MKPLVYGSQWTLPRPADPAAFKSLSWAERLWLAGRLTCAASPLFPSAAYIFHAARVITFYLMWWLICIFPNEGLHVPLGPSYAKLVVWAAFWESLGIGTSTGPLGEGHHGTDPNAVWTSLQDQFANLRLRITLGSVKVPLLPGLPLIRGRVDQLLILADLSAMAVFLLSPFSLMLLRWALFCLTVHCILDRAVYHAMLGFYYYPFLVCLSYSTEPTVWLPACQLVQVAQLFWAGLAKLGPWFMNGGITAQMVGNGLVMPSFLRRRMFKNIDVGDLRPSSLAVSLSWFGLMAEIAGPLMAVFPGEGIVFAGLRWLGTSACAGVHAFIVSNFPLGSLMEWNTFNLISTALLYAVLPVQYGIFANGALMFPALPGALVAFLVSTLYLIPLLGLWKPALFSYCFLLQQYTGNWPAKSLLIKKSALAKVSNCIPLLMPQNLDMVSGSDEDLHFFLGCAFEAIDFRRHLNQRALRNILARGTSHGSDKYLALDSRLLTAVNHGDVTMLTDNVLRKVTEVCDLRRGDLIIAIVPSFNTLGPRCSHWTLRDAAALDDMVIACGTVTPKEMRWYDTQEDGKNPEGGGLVWHVKHE